MIIDIHILCLQYLASNRGKQIVEDFFKEADGVIKEAVLSLIREEALNSCWQDINSIN